MCRCSSPHVGKCDPRYTSVPRWIEWLNDKSKNGNIVAVKVQQAR